MLEILKHRTYRRLFAAQIIALAGTGLLTVGLALLAYDLAGDGAGAVLGTALAVKMVAYVGVAPLAGAFAARLPRRGLLIGLDIGRAALALLLPFVTEIWQIYVLIFALQSFSAAFTPTFQATIPDILPDEAQYTRALSLSRLAYDLENLLSPTLAAILLMAVSYHSLFVGTVAGFLLSASLVFSTRLPRPARKAQEAPFRRKITQGMRIYLATPRLRGLLALNLSVAAAGAMVIVNTVVIVRGLLGRSENELAIAMGCFGGGSMLAALLLPRLLDRVQDRQVMLPAAVMLGLLLPAFAGVLLLASDGGRAASWLWPALLVGWALLGIGYSAVQTPTGRLLRRSSHADDRPDLFAAQFALSHATWLVTYPLAGWLGAAAGMPATLMALGALTLAGAALAARLWPAGDPEALPHAHPDLPPDHPHLRDGDPVAGPPRTPAHRHRYVIDELHHAWPSPGRG